MAKRYVRKKKKGARLGCGLWTVLIAAAALLVVILVISLSSRKQEEAPRAADALWDGGWYEDDLGYIQNDKALVKGMKAFEKKTGLKPYLTLMDGVDPEELDYFAGEQYEALFGGGDHLLVVYDEWEENEYYLSAKTGEGSSLTDEDLSWLLSCLEKAYADPANETYAEAFGAGFARGGRELSVKKEKSGVGLLIVLGLLLILLSGTLVLFLRKKARDTARWDRDDVDYDGRL